MQRPALSKRIPKPAAHRRALRLTLWLAVSLGIGAPAWSDAMLAGQVTGQTPGVASMAIAQVLPRMALPAFVWGALSPSLLVELGWQRDTSDPVADPAICGCAMEVRLTCQVDLEALDGLQDRAADAD